MRSPVGYDATTEPDQLDPGHCQQLVNLLNDRAGLLRGNVQLDTLALNAFPSSIDGVGWFYGQDSYYSGRGAQVAATTPHLLVVQNGALTSFPLVTSPSLTFPPTFTPPGVSSGPVFIVGQRVKFFGFLKECYAVQNLNNFNNFRITATGAVYPMGISAPLSVLTATQTPTTPSQVITGCTGAGVPIVLTFAAPHNLAGGQRVIVSGVGGNTNANGFAYAYPLSATTLQLFANAISSYPFNVVGGQINVTSAVPASYELYAQGAFAGYTYAPGDHLLITGGASNVNPGQYAISGKVTDDILLLATNPLSSGLSGTNVSAAPLSNQKVGNGTAVLTTSSLLVPYYKTGVVQYLQTFVDTQGRESSPSVPVSVDFTNPNDALITMTGLANATISGEVAYAYLYATTAGNTQGYRIAQVTWTGGGDPTYEDNTPDQVVDAAGVAIAPGFGENNIPLPASLAVVHHNRVFLNTTVNAGVMQVSNIGSATQFASVPANPQDGITLQVCSDQGNVVNGLASFGSMLAIFLRRGLYVLQGEDYTDWDLRGIHERGCIAPDSVVRADNHIVWLSSDGCYIASYIYRFQIEKFSKPIEADLQTYSATPAGQAQLEAAVGAFVNNCYHLAVGNTIFRYDFDIQGWCKLRLSGAASITSMQMVQQPGLPAFVLVGRSDKSVCLLDQYTPNQTCSGMVYRTRIIQPDPGDAAGKDQTSRTLRKRGRRTRVYGAGTISSGTITLTVDGRTEGYPVQSAPGAGFSSPTPEEAQQGILISQHWTPNMTGREVDVTLSLSGTGVAIAQVEHQSVSIG